MESNHTQSPTQNENEVARCVALAEQDKHAQCKQDSAALQALVKQQEWG